LGDPAQPDEFGWVDSILSERGSTRHPREDDESHLIRTVFVLLLLGGLAGLLAYSIRSVAAGEGRHVFLFMATLAALLACGAAVIRTRIWLRFLLVLGSLCVFALLVDQFVYYRWHKGVERVVTGLQQGMESGSPAMTVPMEPGPTSFSIDPDRGVLLKFEPPILAWMYHLDSASPLGHTLAAGWYRILSKVTRGRRLDGVAQTIVRPHEVYAVGVMSDEGPPVCRADETGQWTLSIDTRRGRRSL
jgi:hypothetical protein